MDLRAQQMISLWRYHEVSMVKKQVNGETQKRVSPKIGLPFIQVMDDHDLVT
jgi:hypothetical protein